PDRLPAEVDVLDGAAGAVEDAELVVVAQGEHLIAGGVDPTGQEHLIGAEVSFGVEGLAGSAVEVIDVAEPGGNHQRLAAVASRVEPGGHELLAGLDVGRGLVDALAGVVGVERLAWVAVAQAGQGLALPGLGLPAVVSEVARSDP